MSKTTNKFAPEVRDRAVRMVLDHGGEHSSPWAAVVSVASKIGSSAHTLNEWVKKAEVDSFFAYLKTEGIARSTYARVIMSGPRCSIALSVSTIRPALPQTRAWASSARWTSKGKHW